MLPKKVVDKGKYTSCSFRVMSLDKVQSVKVPELGKAKLQFFALVF
jgi:hypothetical protein